MFDTVTESPMMQASATYTEDSSYDSPISNDSTSHAHDTGTDEDISDSSASDSEKNLHCHTTHLTRTYKAD